MPFNPGIPLLEITQQTNTHICKIPHSKMLTALLLSVTKDWKQPEFPSWGLI